MPLSLSSNPPCSYGVRFAVRIPFAACMYKKTRDVLRHYKGLYIISAWHVLLALAWLALWIFGVSGAVSLPHGGWYAALLVLSLAWSIEVLRNIVYVTVAGLVGTYYYEVRSHHLHLGFVFELCETQLNLLSFIQQVANSRSPLTTGGSLLEMPDVCRRATCHMCQR